MRFGAFAQAAAKIFSTYEQGTLDTSAPKRVADQVGQWIGHLSRNAAINWAPNLADPDVCTFCEQDAIADCIACGDPTCIAHAHISHRAQVICDECVAKLLANSGRKPRRKRSSMPKEPKLPPEILQAFSVIGVPPTSDWDAVNAAYRAAAVANHPDRFQGIHKAKAEAQMKNINAAFAALKEHFQKAA